MKPAKPYRLLQRAGLWATACFLTCCGTSAPPVSPTTLPVVARPTPTASALPASFQITFSADAACTMLPPVARSRTYLATTTPVGGASSYVVINLGAATFGGDGSYLWHSVYARFIDDAAHLFFQDPPIWEQLPANQYVVIYGVEAIGAVGTLPATLSFQGDFTFCADAEPDQYPECEVPATVCASTNHTLTIANVDR